MIKFDIQSNIISVINWVKRQPNEVDKKTQENLTKIGLIASREAKRYAPFKSGALENSITYRVGQGYVSIEVPSNSRAGKYAYIRHENSYNYGAGTKIKGAQAGRLYIKRAIDDNWQKFKSIMENIYR